MNEGRVEACLNRLLEARDNGSVRRRLLADLGIEADRDLSILKMGPMLGLNGTFIPMSPALVRFSTTILPLLSSIIRHPGVCSVPDSGRLKG